MFLILSTSAPEGGEVFVKKRHKEGKKRRGEGGRDEERGVEEEKGKKRER